MPITLGEWEIIDPGNSEIRIHVYDVDADDYGRPRDYGHDICVVCDVGADSGEGNARAIAALPALVQALQVILNSDMAMRAEDEGRVSEGLQLARAALKKAGLLE